MNKKFTLIVFCLGVFSYLAAQNPIIQTNFTADPAPMVYNDKVYLYTTQDEDNSSWFVMNNWRLYTTTDMVNWTDYGVVLSYSDFEWAKGDAWAPQCIERDGKFYMYVPVISKENNRPAVGVAVADSPYGPFYDPLNKPLVQSGNGDIDPSVFIDDDGEAYLYWGNPNVYYVKLNEDMISFSGEIVEVPMTEKSFGKREGNIKERPTLYEEAPWLYKRNDLYYLLWGGGPIPEHLGYSTSNSPEGPWEYGGVIMPTEGRSFTNHPGIIDYKGKTYLFYHDGSLPGGGGFNRSVCVDEVHFNEDGSIQQMSMGDGIKESLGTINPYRKNESVTIAFSEGLKASRNEKVGGYVNAMKDGAYMKVRDVDFGESGPSQFSARVGTTHNNGVKMEVRIDNINGELLGTINVPITGGDDRWQLRNMNISGVSGVHDLYFIFRGDKPGRIMYFDYWMFTK